MKTPTALTVGITASLLLGTLAGAYTAHENRQLAERQLTRHTHLAANLLYSQMQQIDLKLQALQGLVMGAGLTPHTIPDHEHLGRYLANTPPLAGFPLIRGFCLIQPVEAHQTEAFVALARQQIPDFTLKQYADHEGSRFVLTYIEPVAILGNAYGLDLASEPMRKATLERALALGRAQLTPPLASTGKALHSTPDYLITLPVRLPEDQALLGWVGAPVYTEDLWPAITSTDWITFTLQDGATTFSNRPQNPAPKTAESLATRLLLGNFTTSRPGQPLSAEKTFKVMGRQWQLQAMPTPAFYQQLNTASVAYAAFLASVLGLTITLLGLYARRRQLDKEELERNQQTLLGQLIDAAPCGMMFIDQDHRFVAVNQRLCDLTGHPRGKLINAYFHLIMGKTDAGENLLANSTSQPSHTIGDISFEMMAKRADGSQFPAAVGFSTLAVGEQRYIVATLDDISARRAIEQRVQDSEYLFRSLASAMPQHVWMANQDVGLTFINSRMKNYFGRELDQLQVRHWPEMIHPEDLAATQSAYEYSIKHSSEFEAECRLKRHDGQYRWHITRGYPIVDQKTQKLMWYGTNTDISDYKKIQIESQNHAKNTQAILDSVADALITIDESGIMTTVNQSATTMFGYSEAEMVGENVSLIMPEPHKSMHNRYLEKYRRTHEGKIIRQVSNLEGRHKDGMLFKIELRVAENNQFGKRYFVGMIRDITERYYNEKLLESQDKILSLIARNTEMHIILDELVRDIENLTPDLRASVHTLDPNKNRLMHAAAPSLPANYNAAMNNLEIGPKSSSCGAAAFFGRQIIVEDVLKDPTWNDFHNLTEIGGFRACWSTPILAKNELLGIFSLYLSKPLSPSRLHQRIINMATHVASLAISHERRETQIRQLAFYDSLTKLPNRSLGLDRLTRAIADAHRRDERLAVIFIDLDGFKNINDSLGHHVGDKLLVMASNRLNDCVRENDTVARLGGDEFFVILNGTSDNIADVVSEKILAAMSDEFQIDNQSLHVSCSMGIALFPADGHDAATLLRNADAAMYKAKEDGRNTVKYYTADMNRSAVERITIEQEIRLGLARGEFELFYQPRVNNTTNTLIGLEALVRWQHPQRGFLPPNVFIPIAEQSGLIVALGEWVLLKACSQLKEWLDAGYHPLAVSVNLSPRQFHDQTLIEKVTRALTQADLPAQHLELEITESMVMDEGPNIIATLNELKAVGVNLAIDDFGTGYSNLARLKHLPVDVIKIDKSFVDGIPHDADDVAIATSIIAMARHLRLKIVAEGVETHEQRQFLRAQQCDEMQGYLFGKPESASRTWALLSDAKSQPTAR
ncbi:EAL domain-containing protein [Simiduia sp. 21SJ11W-1]|uniref:EAL domain-containing protein n=1 Tax=Simiduia sp. 21SJ11W-1 TaxID=2909669 RepID=UPI00209D685F|nr:EAL domain-containing protein [Simiduia sp. 21SJ11W-1]UTA47182.1 EAL domain-containing protein [Simiduia sp. 21SJ11W-1]